MEMFYGIAKYIVHVYHQIDELFRVISMDLQPFPIKAVK